MNTIKFSDSKHLSSEWWKTYVSEVYWPVVELAIYVGNYQRQQFRSNTFSIHTKTTDVDLVTAVDEASDKMIVNTLKKLFPSDDILSEEGGQSEQKSHRLWIVDPLDGTTNFASGLPIFAVSIALWEQDKPIFGLVFAPMLTDLAVAELDKGAYLNGQRCQVSPKTILNQCVLGTGFPYDRATARNCNATNVAQIIPKVRGIRRMGAAAYDLVLVAAGHLDGFWELRLSIWDIAAAKLMITESQGIFYEQIENNLYSIATGNQEIINQILENVDLKN